MGDFRKRHPSLINTLMSVFIFVAIIALVWVFGASGSRGFDMKFEDEEVNFYIEDDLVISLSKDDVESVELIDELDRGDRVELMADSGYVCGIWENEEFGQYTLYVKSNIKEFIVVRTKDEIYVVNYNNADFTESLYDALLEWEI